jgi:pimeloyl-ACP methyl ester carboxylesterase
MSYIANIKYYPSKQVGAKPALVMCGFGGSIWQVKQLTSTLNRAGYNVTALDFPESVLGSGDPRRLPMLVDEVVRLAEDEAKKSDEPILLVGVSLGALVTLNILRRSSYFHEGVLITGGDIVKIARKLYPEAWQPLAYEEHVTLWQSVNMYTDPESLKGKRLLFVLPKRDKLIEIPDIHRETATQQQAGNALTLIQRGAFGHVGTIVEETILFPRRTLDYIRQVQIKGQ